MLQTYRPMIARTSLFSMGCVLALSAAAQAFLPPAPYGGQPALKWFFEQELRYSTRDLEAKVDGDVELAFIVGTDGTAKNVRVTHLLSEDAEREAMRLLSLIRWHPASVGGSALDKEHSIAVPFNLKRYMKLHGKDAAGVASFMAFPADPTQKIYADRTTDSLATPLIPKGWKGLPTYFGENLRYPEDARRRDMQGKVVVDFVVEASGSISNLRTLEALSGGCDEEAMRLVRSVAWKPAFKEGQRVRSVLKLDVQFRLAANQRP
jgi:TonB family protein